MKLKILIVLFCIGNSTILMGAKQSKPVEHPADITALFQTINSRAYCSDILPYDFSCMLLLLDHGKKNKKPTSYFERVLRLFTRLVKETPCINAYTLNDTLARLPELLHDSICPTIQTQLDTKKLLELEINDRFKGSVNSLLYTRFLHEYAGFKKDPDQFLEQLSDQITQVFKEETNIGQLRTILVRFLETCLAKLAWASDGQERIWDSTKSISVHLKKLVDTNIIDDVDDLDDTYWSLIHRFCCFLDLWGNQLSTEFYNMIQVDINSKKLLLTELEEQQDWLVSKADFLQHNVQGHKARMLAFQNGILAR